jgi:hypothetical protein
LVERYFNDVQSDISFIKFKKINPNEVIYELGDPISHIYLILSGELKLIFQKKHMRLPAEIIVGDFEPADGLSKRISTLKTETVARVATLPIDFYFNIKEPILEQEHFIADHLPICDKRAKYLFTRYFRRVALCQKEELRLERNGDIALIKCGLFTTAKCVCGGIKHQRQMSAGGHSPLCQVGKGELTKENIVCESATGEVLVCSGHFLRQLIDKFEEVTISKLCYEHPKSVPSLPHNLTKNVWVPPSELPTSIQQPYFNKVEKLRFFAKKPTNKPKTE